jgi:hypothetical protein
LPHIFTRCCAWETGYRHLFIANTPPIYEQSAEFNALRAKAAEEERNVMRQNVATRRLDIQAALSEHQLSADAINARLCARRAELEENLYDGILARPPAPVSSVPVYGARPVEEQLEAARRTVYANVLYYFKRLLDEKHELLSQY